MRQGCTGLPPHLTLLLHRVFAKFLFSLFHEIFNYLLFITYYLLLLFIILNFAKFKENFAKHEIQNFTKLRKQKFCSHPTPTQSALSATQRPLPSARRFFNAVRQCYFEIKMNTEPHSTTDGIVFQIQSLKGNRRAQRIYISVRRQCCGSVSFW